MAYIETDNAPINLGSGYGSNGGFFNGDGIWAIILFAMIFGWGWGGNSGFGFGGNGAGAVDGYVLTSDFANIERKIDGVNTGICDGFYAMNTSLLNGFAGVNSNITNASYQTLSGIKDTQYAIAMQTNAIQQSLCTGFRDVIDSQNANYRALHDEIVANRLEDKNAQIAAQQNEINRLQLSASQSAQNAYLLSELKPCPSAAYIVPNPNCCYNYGVTQMGTCGSVL